ncbi:molybdenum cofactor synthesis domain protein [Thermogladius calderae 1633]|uniref:Molybdenum cofactor synthesis domain protein n=1 Tax=Thermogladius calderae (strain DSM 22663 / VKM B-2946 / 1633) TaxID=1184251 RepID=I3TFZ1_THEC1|nr:molybdopterin molybdotransferase MoeA [Thermogladius calderae]AFK51679.1 molybdenum cofactor synthesis domain protein [Thermogladius calderae 1633]
MKGIKELVSIHEAVSRLARVLAKIELDVEEVDVAEAYGRVLAGDVVALVDHPGFDRSAVDGYAVVSSDTYSASVFNPAELELVDAPVIGPGKARPISTGAPLPSGADAVVMEEDVKRVGGKILVYKPVAQGSNVSRRAEDFARGEVLVRAGTVLDFRKIPIIYASGYSTVRVFRRLRVGVVTVGSEVVEPGPGTAGLEGGRVFNSTGYVVLSYLRRLPFIEARYYGVIPDDLHLLADFVTRALALNDIVITTGGTGPSEGDLVYDLVERGGAWVFRGVAMRPGRPTSASVVDGKPVLHLSGFPLAAWVGLEGVFKAALVEAFGLKGLGNLIVYAKLTRRLPNQAGYTTFVRSTLTAGVGGLPLVEPFMLRGSGLLRSLAETNSYIRLEEGSEGFEEGEVVPVYLD